MSDLLDFIFNCNDENQIGCIALILIILSIIINTVFISVIYNKKDTNMKMFLVLPLIGLVSTIIYTYNALAFKQNMEDSEVMFYSAATATATTILTVIIGFIL